MTLLFLALGTLALFKKDSLVQPNQFYRVFVFLQVGDDNVSPASSLGLGPASATWPLAARGSGKAACPSRVPGAVPRAGPLLVIGEGR